MPLANVTQYRKSVGTYNNKPHPASKKSMRKAIRKARRSHESISTQTSSYNTRSVGSCAVRALLVVGLAASLVGTSTAMSNGQLRESSAASRATFPYLGCASASNPSYCSSIRLNNRQLLTAKHCLNDGFRPWTWTDNLWGWDWASHQLDYPDDKVDLSILTFNTDLQKNARCIPMMSKETQELLKNSPKDACGSTGPIIVLGNGRGENTGCLQSAVFDFHNIKCKVNKASSIKGIKIHNKAVHTNVGDSGAAVMGCNPKTGGYELMGMNIAGGRSPLPDNKYSCFVDIAYFPEISGWIQNNTEAYSCSEEIIKGEDLYDLNYDYEENQQSNKCNIKKTPLSFINSVASFYFL